MPLQQLAEYFNDRLERENYPGYRPFVLKSNRIQGMFDKYQIRSDFLPVYEARNASHIVGHIARASIIENKEYQSFINPELINKTEYNWIVHYDRFVRTVHMLNYLPQANSNSRLILDVDPRHILGIKTDHGAYFEEIINKCGLETNNIVISLSISSVYANCLSALLKGIENYQRRGYKILIKIPYLLSGLQNYQSRHYRIMSDIDVRRLEKLSLDLINKVSPDYVGLFAQDLEQPFNNQFIKKIIQFNSFVISTGSRSLLLNIDEINVANFFMSSGFSLGQGLYFDHAHEYQEPMNA